MALRRNMCDSKWSAKMVCAQWTWFLGNHKFCFACPPTRGMQQGCIWKKTRHNNVSTTFQSKNYEKQRWRVDANNSRNANFDNFVNADKKCSLKYIKQAMCSQIYSGSNPFPCPNVSTSANWLDEISSETSSLHLSFPDALSTCLLVFDGHCSNTFLGMPYASTQVWVKIGSCKK